MTLLFILSFSVFAQSTRTVIFNVFKIQTIQDGKTCIYYGTAKYTHKTRFGNFVATDRTYAITDVFSCKKIKSDSLVSCDILKVTSELDYPKESNLVAEGRCEVK